MTRAEPYYAMKSADVDGDVWDLGEILKRLQCAPLSEVKAAMRSMEADAEMQSFLEFYLLEEGNAN